MNQLKINNQTKFSFFLIVTFYTLHFLCNEMFVYKSLFYFYFLTTTTCILLIINAIKIIQDINKPAFFSINILTIIPIIFVISPLIFMFGVGKVEWYSSISLICVFMLILLFSFSFSNKYLNTHTIENTIIIFSISESLICILQHFDIYIQSQYFSVTGSNANPNITAMFLIMSLPLIFKKLLNTVKFKMYLIALVIIIIFAAIVLLKSRTAYICLIVEIILLSIYYIKNKSKLLLNFFISFSIVAAIFISIKLYNFKENSADGRLFVWKVAIHMITEKPFGYGFGMVQSEYNRAQAIFFNENPTTETEKRNATYMTNLMNDYIELSIQGGIIIGSLYLIFITLTVYKSFSNLKNNLFYILCVLVFAIMSLFNFALYSPFAALVFAYCISVLNFNRMTLKSITFSKPFAVVLVLFSILPLLYFSLQVHSQMQLKQIENQIKARKYDNLKSEFIKSKLCISTSEIYYRIGGDIYSLEKDYKTALNFYSEAIKYAPFPKLIIRKAYCEAMLNNEYQAISDLKLAKCIQITLFEPDYNLMMIYLKQKDLKSARQTANLILNKQIKVPSERIEYYKEQAKKIIQINKLHE